MGFLTTGGFGAGNGIDCFVPSEICSGGFRGRDFLAVVEAVRASLKLSRRRNRRRARAHTGPNSSPNFCGYRTSN